MPGLLSLLRVGVRREFSEASVGAFQHRRTAGQPVSGGTKREPATSAPAELGEEIHIVSRNRARTQALLQARKSHVLRKWHRLVPSGSPLQAACLPGSPSGGLPPQGSGEKHAAGAPLYYTIQCIYIYIYTYICFIYSSLSLYIYICIEHIHIYIYIYSTRG